MNVTDTGTAFGPILAEGWAPQQRVQADIKTVSVCDTQPVTAEGIRTLLSEDQGLRFLQAADSLARAKTILRDTPPSVLMLDKAFGIQVLLEWLADTRSGGPLDLTANTAIVIWGASITEAEALRFLQAGARGILRKTAGITVILACLRSVAGGRSWMEESVFGELGRGDRYPRSELTVREQQVLELVEQGWPKSPRSPPPTRFWKTNIGRSGMKTSRGRSPIFPTSTALLRRPWIWPRFCLTWSSA